MADGDIGKDVFCVKVMTVGTYVCKGLQPHVLKWSEELSIKNINNKDHGLHLQVSCTNNSFVRRDVLTVQQDVRCLYNWNYEIVLNTNYFSFVATGV